MAQNFYQLRNYGALAFSYAMTATIAAATYTIGMPAILGFAAAYTTLATIKDLRANKHVFENNLKQHEDNYSYSPKLKQIVQELYTKSGLSADKYPIHDFDIDDAKPQKRGIKYEAIRQRLRSAYTAMPNAAAIDLGKPVIMISKSLLEILNDHEEKAVLAHEFSHIVAKHSTIDLPQQLIHRAARSANGILYIFSTAATGVVNFTVGLLATIVVPTIAAKLSGFGALVKKMNPENKGENDRMTDADRKRLSRIAIGCFGLGIVTNVAFFSAINPMIAGIFLATWGLGRTARITSATLSRSQEYQADRGAVLLGADPLALVTALRKINEIKTIKMAEAGHDSTKQPSKLSRAWANLHASHPTVERRIGRLSAIARQSGYGEDHITFARTCTLDLSGLNQVPHRAAQAYTNHMT
ncbi:M48 family metallopeptidase [Micavibrio aeruginosavorus]|uniref:M48 family metallopeptidase n=1 Tax=Micavibrio aeruginosavorus TaxID=349221 RepID=UPI003F4AB74F